MIIFYQILFEISNFNKPSWHGLVYKWSITSPTIRIVVNLSTTLYYSSFLFNIFNNNFVSIFYVNSFVNRDLFSKFSILIDRDWRIIRVNDSFSDTHLVIFLTEARCAMNNSCTWIVSYKVSNLNFEASIFFSINKEIKHRNILFAL